MGRCYFVYFMSNESKMLYVGVSNDLMKRVFQHKSKRIPGFTQKYNLYKLVYFEQFGDIRAAIAREKEIKGWLRSKKVALIVTENPHWKDLAESWFKRPSKTNSSTHKTVANRIPN
ncbi:MAG TPA: GIY-YIG nuclease family protein [Candidatus Baltobacteraceae bacterium]|nr:GIY-YIG nuclease family protein [Candidatus Baltobacteraceae bacterium]